MKTEKFTGQLSSRDLAKDLWTIIQAQMIIRIHTFILDELYVKFQS